MAMYKVNAYNRSTGAMIVAESNWIPGNAAIMEDSWSVAENGRLTFEFGGETEMFWEESRVETCRGYSTYMDEYYNPVGEEDIVLISDDGDVIDFTPCHMKHRSFNDHPARQSAFDLLLAAYAVIDNWSSGDLAGAVSDLGIIADTLRNDLGLERPEMSEEGET